MDWLSFSLGTVTGLALATLAGIAALQLVANAIVDLTE